MYAFTASSLEFQTTVGCRFFHFISKEGVTEIVGRAGLERRRVIGRKINEVLRLIL